MLLLKRIISILIFLSLPLISRAEVFVSPTLATDTIINNYIIQPGSIQAIPLPSKGTIFDSYSIQINATNAVYRDITAFLVDQQNLLLYQSGQPFRGIGYQKAIAPFVIQGSTKTPGQKYLVLDNRYALVIAKKINISITAKFPLDEAEKEKFKTVFSQLYSELKRNYIFPDFNIHVEPCGQANAFSESFGSGDVHYCTELISQLARTNNQGAFAAIFFHEVGHSLLGLWGIPGNNNEDIADEFSTYTLMSSGPDGYALLVRSLEFWQNRDSNAEAAQMILKGDRHSLSVQRIRNIKENMQSGEAFIKRWNRLVYQHATNEKLKKIVSNPTFGDDVTSAQNILKERQDAE